MKTNFYNRIQGLRHMKVMVYAATGVTCSGQLKRQLGITADLRLKATWVLLLMAVANERADCMALVTA